MKMQPGDYILKEDIADEETLNRIREVVRAQGWQISDVFCKWEHRDEGQPPGPHALVLTGNGYLGWSYGDNSHGRRLTPADILGEGHPAADLLQELADVARENPRPWEEFEWQSFCSGAWEPCVSNIDVITAWEAFDVRRRPRTKKIGNYDVPLPVREPLEMGQEYYVASTTEDDYRMDASWGGYPDDYTWLSRGLIHLDPSSAETHGRAMASLMQEDNR